MTLQEEKIILIGSMIYKRINRSGIVNACYGIAMLVIIMSIIGGLAHSLLFLGNLFNHILFVSETEAGAEAAMFDVSSLLPLASRLNITIPSEHIIASSTPLVSVSLQTEPADISSPHLQILNNTAIIGLAKQWQQRFADAGFADSEIGNIRSGNYHQMHIRYAPHNKLFIEKISTIIASFQGIINEETEDSSLGDTIVIIIGT